MASQNGKADSKLNISIINNNAIVRAKQKESNGGGDLLSKCTKCVLENFELSYGPLSDECKSEILKKPGSFLFKYFLDLFACFLIITPCIISFWRGVWDYAVIYLEKDALNNNCYYANGICLVVGIVGTQTIQWSQYWVKKNLAGAYNPTSSPARFYFVSRLFSLVWGFCDIYMWKGIWDGLYCVSGFDIPTSTAALVIGTAVLVVSKTYRSALSLPVGIVIDDRKANCCAAQTFWDSPPSEPFRRRFIDISLSFFLEACVVLHWHGVWTLEDIAQEYYGQSKSLSGFISLGVGGALFFVSFLLQFPFTLFCKREDVNFKIKLVVNFFVTTIGVLATVNTFRGYWYIMDEYLLKAHYELSLLNGMIYGAVLLYALHCGSSMHAGIIRDIEQGTMIETCYTTYFFIKKMNKLQTTENGHLKDNHNLEVPLLVVTQSPTQIIPDELQQHDHIDVGFLGDELLSDEEEDFNDVKEFKEKSHGLEMKI